MPGEEYLPQNVKPVVKYGGGSVTVWGVVTSDGVRRLHRINGNMDAKQFISILSTSLLDTVLDHHLNPTSIILAQDRDPKHTSRLAQAWFQQNHVALLPWAPSSPDMNIIENVWELLDRRIRWQEVRPHTVDELWEVMQEEWKKIGVEEIQRLYRSMPARVAALKKARGGYTKY